MRVPGDRRAVQALFFVENPPALHESRALLTRQGRLYFLEGIEVFLQAADVLLHVRDGRAELACSSKRAPEAAGKLRTGSRRGHRTADITERERSEQHPDRRDTSNQLVWHLWLLLGP